MLFLVGTRDSNIKNGIISNEKCPKCNTQKTLHFSIYKRYAHITLIPLFPVGKCVYIKCNECAENFDYEDLSEIAQLQLRNEKLDNSIWMFSGSITIAIFLIFTIHSYFEKKDEAGILIKNPTKGDVYNLKLKNGYYSNMRIDTVTTDSIYATLNDFNAYMPNEIDDLNKPENYSKRKVYYSRNDLIKLYQENEILKITKKEITTGFSN